jgi:hypothetical protein
MENFDDTLKHEGIFESFEIKGSKLPPYSTLP